MPAVRLVVAACLLLVLTACGATPTATEAHESSPSHTPSAAGDRADLMTKGAITRSVREDVTLVVSPPTSFTPTETAYPKAARAVAFEMVIDNQSDTMYRPAQLSFIATAGGRTAGQIIDSTQGYNGVTSTADEVSPNQILRFSVAFGVPPNVCMVRMAVRTEASATSTIALFEGII